MYSSVSRIAADDLRALFRHRDLLDPDALRDILDAMLVERLGGDAVRKALHHERAVGHRRQDVRRDLRVVAEQIAFGQLLLRPEHLVQVGHREPLAARQFERAVAPGVFERAEVIDEGGERRRLKPDAPADVPVRLKPDTTADPAVA